MTFTPNSYNVRPFAPGDEDGWVRCRTLAFLTTQYYDDVKPHRGKLDAPSIGLVATDSLGHVVGVLDIEVDGTEATIDTIAVHPDHQNRGLATSLLEVALAGLSEARVTTLDAWTREDVAANEWYQRSGFQERYRYLHVYLSDGDDSSGFLAPEPLSKPHAAFAHGHIDDEDELRSRYQRVHVCRQYVRDLR